MKFFGAVIVFFIAFMIVIVMIALLFLRNLLNRLRQHVTHGTQQRKWQRPQERRRTTTSSGVTIIDERSREETERKIFTQDEGEYVDFVEESE